MQKAQTISSLVLSIRQKEKIKVRQPLQKIMIPVLDEKQRSEIEAVADLIKTEVNVKEIKLLDDASGILVKRIKPNFKVLGPRFGKEMKLISIAVGKLEQNDIQKIEREGKNAFFEYSLPEAILRFRQGCGRLIRSREDKGIIVVLDTRVVTTRYGKAFLESLPPCPVHTG